MPSFLDASSLFGKQSTAEFEGCTVQLIEENGQKNDDPGPMKFITAHWSAGNYTQCFNSYHAQICYNADTQKAFIVKCLKFSQKAQGTWSRNSNNWNVSFAGEAAGCPVVQAQIDMMAQLIGEVCAWKEIDPKATIELTAYTCDKEANHIWATGGTIKAATVSDHRHFAVADGYPQWRSDVGSLYPQVLAKAQGHYDSLKAGKTEFLFKDFFTE